MAPTWSSIEANGRHKVLYYSAKDIYEPVIIFPYLNDTTQKLEVWVTSDQWESISGVAQFSWFDLAGNELLLPGDSQSGEAGTNTSSFETSFNVGPINSTRVLTYNNVSALFQTTDTTSTSTVSINNAVLRLQVTASPSSRQGKEQQPRRGSSQQSQYTHTYWFHPTSLANCDLLDPGLKLIRGPLQADSGDNSPNKGTGSQQSVTFTVTAQKAVAAWVWLDYSSSQVQGLFDNNGFWLNKGESTSVSFMVYNDWTGDGSWINSVVVRSLYDNLVD